MPSRGAQLIAGILLFANASGLPAQARIWNSDDRITITSFNDVSAVAFDGRRVFAATANGLEIYDALTRKWLPPSTIEDGYPMFERPIAMAYDRSQGGLWLQTATSLYLWSDLSGRWDQRFASELPDALRTRSAPADTDIAWRVLRGTITLDSYGRRWPLSAVVPADRPGTYWVGTGGGNIVLADTRNLSGQWLSFGTLSRGTSALAIGDGNTIWFGSDGAGPRQGLTRTDLQLENWTYYEPLTARAPRRQIQRILSGGQTWVAAADGVYALARSARSWRRIGEAEGLPSDNTGALLETRHGLLVGTTHGVALIDTATLTVSWKDMAGTRIYGLVERNDTVWIASEVGLWIATREGARYSITTAPGSDTMPALRNPITGVARVASSIAILAYDGVYLFDTGWTTLAIRNAALVAGGRALQLRGEGDDLFVLGSRGLARWSKNTRQWSHLTVPADLPHGPVYDVVKAGEFLWIATPAGAVRLKWP